MRYSLLTFISVLFIVAPAQSTVVDYLQKIVAPGATGSTNFGLGGCSINGNIMACGSNTHDVPATNAGYVTVYKRPSINSDFIFKFTFT